MVNLLYRIGWLINMPKAYLVSMNCNVESGTRQDVMDMRGDNVASYFGPRRYEYHLTYISTEPFEMRGFPHELDAETFPQTLESDREDKAVELERLD